MSPGFHLGVPAEKYHQDPCVVPSLNNTVGKILDNATPLKAKFSHPKLNPDYREKQDDKFDIGKVAHSIFLENDPSRVVVVEAKDWRTDKAKEERDGARAAGKTALLQRHFKDVMAMVKAADAFVLKSEIGSYWLDGESEVTGIALEDGVWLRSRFDRISKNRRVIMDYKSTTDASPEGFSRQIVRMGYDFQEAFYRRVARALGVTGPRFVFLAQECEPPYECSLHGCDPAMQEIADAKVERAIRIWQQCTKTKEWPSYGGRIHWTIPTTWQMNEHEMRLQEEEETA